MRSGGHGRLGLGIALTLAVSLSLSASVLAGAQASATAAPVVRAPLTHRARAAAIVVAPADRTAPVSVRITTPVTTQSTAASTHLAVAWAATDSASGVASYDVRLRIAAWNGTFGPYSTWRSATTAHSATYTTSSGRTVCFSVRARDHAANLSSWSTDRCSTTPLDDRSLTASSFARRTSSRAFAGTVSTATAKSASLTRTSIVARSLAAIVSTCPTCGSFAARWNGKTIKSISLASGSASRIVALASFTKATRGTLQLVVTTSGKPVTVDAVEVENTPLTGSITLAGGATYTKSRNIVISSSVAGASGAVQMHFANGPNPSAAAYSAYSASHAFTLSAGDGTKTVSGQFRDAAASVSGVATDSIVLDTTPPAFTVTPGTGAIAQHADVTIGATVSEVNPIASATLLTTTPGGITFTSTPMALAAGQFTATQTGVMDSFDYTVRVVDAAGNITTMPAVGRYRITVDAPPTSDALINDALTAGTIDYPTSLVYRLWAEFNDPQLPDAFLGGGTGGEDPSLFIELLDQRDNLPPATQALVDPYLLRPDDPNSALAPAAAPAGHLAVPAAGPAHAAAASCPDGLQSEAGPDVRVWSCGITDPARQTVITLMEGLWAQETQPEPAGMGLPVSDGPSAKNGGDSKLDVYLIDQPQCITRSATCEGIPSAAVARAVPAEPVTSNGARRTSSGYILVDRSRVSKPTLKSDLAHEFFHILQYAHNLNAITRVVTPGVHPTYDASWFAEASASWAEWYFANPEGKPDLYSLFAATFQNSNQSLLTFENSGSGHQYASWIWPLYMQDQSGPEAVFSAFTAGEGAATPAQFDDAISAELPFDSNFRDFSVRNWNDVLDGKPIPAWDTVANGSDFPVGTKHVIKNSGTIGTATPLQSEPASNIPVLAAEYDTFDIEDAVADVKLDFSKLNNVDNLDVDVLGELKSTGEWKHIAGNGTSVEFCHAKADTNFDKIVVVMSNHAHDRAADGSGPDHSKDINGPYTITLSACGGIAGSLSYTYSHSGFDSTLGFQDDYTETVSVNLSFQPITQPFPLGFQFQDSGSTFTRTMHETLENTTPSGCHTLFTIDSTRSGSFVSDPTQNPDPMSATVDFAGYDPTNPFVHGPFGVVGINIPTTDHWHGQFDGPTDNCGDPHSSDADILGGATGSLQCVPPAAQAMPLGPGPFYGVYKENGSDRSFDFTCAEQTSVRDGGVPGFINVTGVLQVLDAS